MFLTFGIFSIFGAFMAAFLVVLSMRGEKRQQKSMQEKVVSKFYPGEYVKVAFGPLAGIQAQVCDETCVGVGNVKLLSCDDTTFVEYEKNLVKLEPLKVGERVMVLYPAQLYGKKGKVIKASGGLIHVDIEGEYASFYKRSSLRKMRATPVSTGESSVKVGDLVEVTAIGKYYGKHGKLKKREQTSGKFYSIIVEIDGEDVPFGFLSCIKKYEPPVEQPQLVYRDARPHPPVETGSIPPIALKEGDWVEGLYDPRICEQGEVEFINSVGTFNNRPLVTVNIKGESVPFFIDQLKKIDPPKLNRLWKPGCDRESLPVVEFDEKGKISNEWVEAQFKIHKTIKLIPEVWYKADTKVWTHIASHLNISISNWHRLWKMPCWVMEENAFVKSRELYWGECELVVLFSHGLFYVAVIPTTRSKTRKCYRSIESGLDLPEFAPLPRNSRWGPVLKVKDGKIENEFLQKLYNEATPDGPNKRSIGVWVQPTDAIRTRTGKVMYGVCLVEFTESTFPDKLNGATRHYTILATNKTSYHPDGYSCEGTI